MEFGETRVIPSHNLTYRCHSTFFFSFFGEISPKKKGLSEFIHAILPTMLWNELGVETKHVSLSIQLVHPPKNPLN
jgi:hypothetical protein